MKTLIVDNYDSFTFNLYQIIGELKGKPKVLRNDELTIADIKKGNFSHIVISPGPGSPDEPSYFGICKKAILTFGKFIPLLGVCLGHQGIVSAFGGKVVKASVVKHGKQSRIQHIGGGILKGVKNPLLGMRYHSLIGQKSTLPKCLKVTSVSCDDGYVMGVEHKKYPIFGLQFHPESVGTRQGKKILKNFLSIT